MLTPKSFTQHPLFLGVGAVDAWGKIMAQRAPAARSALGLVPDRPTLPRLRVINPKVLVCLGATAAQALLGASFRVTKSRGSFVKSDLAPLVTATVHPSSILRAPDDAARCSARRAFVQDLRKVARTLGEA